MTESEQGRSLLLRISTQMTQAMKEYYGKGPTGTKSFTVDDMLFVVMRGRTSSSGSEENRFELVLSGR